MRVLLTGGAGYIGSVTAAHLLARGHEVEILDSLVTGHRAALPPEAAFHEVDLADREGIARVFRHPFDAVLHFAAFSLVGESVARPLKYYRNNLGGSRHLLEAVAAGGARRFVFSSTAAVYGLASEDPIRETAPLCPVNPYGRTKLAIEWEIADAAARCGFSGLALRYFNAAGATEIHGEDHRPESHLIPRLLASIAGGDGSFTVFGDDYPTPDGTCIRDYIHVLDLAEAHALAVEWTDAPTWTALNLGTETGLSVREIVAAAAAVAGTEITPPVGPRRAGDPPRLVASAAEAVRLLGWKASRSDIATIIDDAWRWRRRRPGGYPE